jgi:hypothetical protein
VAKVDAAKGYSDKSKKPGYFPRQHQIKNKAVGHQQLIHCPHLLSPEIFHHIFWK